MQNKTKKLFRTLTYCGALAGFIGMALACGSTDKESLQKGWDIGTEIGSSLAGDVSEATVDSMKNDVPETIFTTPELPEVADNNHK